MTPDADNGILAQVPGQFIAAGMQTLHRPDRQGPQEMRVELDADWVGRVEITYQVREHRRGKSLNVFWHAVHARQVGP